MRPTARTTRPLPGTLHDPLYPDWMRKRHMGETDFHAIAMYGLREMLEDCFRDDCTVYVATSIVFYFERGNLAPTLWVADRCSIVTDLAWQSRNSWRAVMKSGRLQFA